MTEEILFKFWIEEKQGYGLKKNQFLCGLKRWKISKISTRLRKDKKVFYSKRRWFIKPEIYSKLKENIK